MPPSTPDDLATAEDLDVDAHVEIALSRLLSSIPDGATRYQVADRLRDRLPWVKAVSAAQVGETDPRGMSGAAETLGVSRQYLDRLLREQGQSTPRKAAQIEERPLGYRYGQMLELYENVAITCDRAGRGHSAQDEYDRLERNAIASAHVFPRLVQAAERWMRRLPDEQRRRLRGELAVAREACGELPGRLSIQQQGDVIQALAQARVARRRAARGSSKGLAVNPQSIS